MRPFATLVAAAIAAAASTAANAAPCAGFADIDSTDPFCPNVEWIRNREVTLGCAAGAYCPHASVSRLQMAAFMNRLGTALTPQERRTDAAPGALDLNASVVAC